jgi:hypothetical protein
MFKFVTDLFSSIGRLAKALNGLAATVERMDEEVQDRFRLEDKSPPPKPEEIDHKQNGFLPPTPNPLPPPVEERPTRKPRSSKVEGA